MGDPFCVPRPFLEEILDDVERYELKLEITTNALLLGDDAQIARLLRLLSRMILSIDGATRETYERVRPPARWDRLLENVERFVAARRRIPRWRRPLLQFNYVAMRSNVHELPDFVDLAAGWDADEVCVALLVEVDPAIEGEKLDVDDPQVRALLAEAGRRATRRGVGFRVGNDAGALADMRSPGLAARLRRIARSTVVQGWDAVLEKLLWRARRVPRECPYLWSKAYVQLDGTVGTCCHPDFYVTGDLRRESFPSIWNGRRYRGLRSSLNGPHPAASCRDCHLLRG
jgi:MoaA/NifB/PqqE/SkfB family radical SAM enzyme